MLKKKYLKPPFHLKNGNIAGLNMVFVSGWDFPGKSTGVGFHCLLRLVVRAVQKWDGLLRRTVVPPLKVLPG